MNTNYISIDYHHFEKLEDLISNQFSGSGYDIIEKEWGIREIDSMTAYDDNFEYDHPDGHMCFRVLDKQKFIFAAMKYSVQFSNLEVKPVV